MNWAHLHLALNHLPVLGTLFVLLLFAVALIRRSAELRRVSLWAFVLVAALTFPIKYTGERAFVMVMAQAGFPDEPIEAHEHAADQATTGVVVVGLLAAVGLFLSRKQRPLPVWLNALVLVAALGTCLLMARAANLGGEIRHPEIHPGFKFSESEK
ncbi:MAG: hypothetical protein HY301_12120 [Verrucomicrobia bacterium]|nr:hypothetical protein [Verrucomicrobiota bacterium]